MTNELIIPHDKVPADFNSPRSLLLLAKPKIGKTSLVAQLEDSLILDFDKGSSFISARKVNIEHYSDLNKVGKALKKQEINLKYIIIDTITAMSEQALVLAEKLYAESSIGKNWFDRDKKEFHSILNLPKGAGYHWLRVAFMKMLNLIKTFAPRIIIVAHTKDEILLSGTNEVETLDIDLQGQLKRLIAQNVDAIGYIYRKKEQNFISFKSKDSVTCGARQVHLRNQEFLISELDEHNEVTSYWEKIFID